MNDTVEVFAEKQRRRHAELMRNNAPSECQLKCRKDSSTSRESLHTQQVEKENAAQGSGQASSSNIQTECSIGAPSIEKPITKSTTSACYQPSNCSDTFVIEKSPLSLRNSPKIIETTNVFEMPDASDVARKARTKALKAQLASIESDQDLVLHSSKKEPIKSGEKSPIESRLYKAASKSSLHEDLKPMEVQSDIAGRINISHDFTNKRNSSESSSLPGNTDCNPIAIPTKNLRFATPIANVAMADETEDDISQLISNVDINEPSHVPTASSINNLLEPETQNEHRLSIAEMASLWENRISAMKNTKPSNPRPVPNRFPHVSSVCKDSEAKGIPLAQVLTQSNQTSQKETFACSPSFGSFNKPFSQSAQSVLATKGSSPSFRNYGHPINSPDAARSTPHDIARIKRTTSTYNGPIYRTQHLRTFNSVSARSSKSNNMLSFNYNANDTPVLKPNKSMQHLCINPVILETPRENNLPSSNTPVSSRIPAHKSRSQRIRAHELQASGSVKEITNRWENNMVNPETAVVIQQDNWRPQPHHELSAIEPIAENCYDVAESSTTPTSSKINDFIDGVFSPISTSSPSNRVPTMVVNEHSSLLSELASTIDNDPTGLSQSQDIERDGSTTPSGEKKPLLHSVSFYRRQQLEASRKAPTVRVKVDATASQRSEMVPQSSDFEEQRKLLEDRIIQLGHEAKIQEAHIQQLTRVIDFCRSKEEFKSSKEKADVHRTMLMANERRRALYNERDRLRRYIKEGDLNGAFPRPPFGTVMVANLSVPLRRQFINENVLHNGDFIYYFVALAKCGPIVHTTQMVDTDKAMQKSSIEFPHLFKFMQLSHDFRVKIELYSFRAFRDMLTHDEKYHLNGRRGHTIKTKSSSKSGSVSGTLKDIFSPSPSLRHHSRFDLNVQPDPSFQLAGDLTLDISSSTQTRFRFDNMPSTHTAMPIEGVCDVEVRTYPETVDEEYHGFLNMYEEVDMSGVWTRYWVVLKQGAMFLWRYPDDEQTKTPIASVDLSKCLYDKVTPLLEMQCSGRPHAFRLDLFNGPDNRRFKVLFSADTASDYFVWTTHINEALHNIKLWRPNKKQN